LVASGKFSVQRVSEFRSSHRPESDEVVVEGFGRVAVGDTVAASPTVLVRLRDQVHAFSVEAACMRFSGRMHGEWVARPGPHLICGLRWHNKASNIQYESCLGKDVSAMSVWLHVCMHLSLSAL
jgi:hypothetical protein